MVDAEVNADFTSVAEGYVMNQFATIAPDNPIYRLVDYAILTPIPSDYPSFSGVILMLILEQPDTGVRKNIPMAFDSLNEAREKIDAISILAHKTDYPS